MREKTNRLIAVWTTSSCTGGVHVLARFQGSSTSCHSHQSEGPQDVALDTFPWKLYDDY